MASNVIKMNNATDIANELLHKHPNIQVFLNNLLHDDEIETKVVGSKCQYPSSVEKNKLHSSYGIFMDYFIRKHLSNQFQAELTDDVTELVLKNAETYFTGKGKDRHLQEDIQKHYEIFKDSQNRAMDILQSIKIVSLSYILSFHDPLPKVEVDTDDISLLEVVKYFKKLRYSGVEMKASTACKYFDGNADLIFDREVLYEIKTSKFKSLSRSDTTIQASNFYKLILYGFGYYKKTGKIIKCFKIYNPLLGLEYTLQLNDIDMKLFEEVIAKDVENNMKIK